MMKIFPVSSFCKLGVISLHSPRTGLFQFADYLARCSYSHQKPSVPQNLIADKYAETAQLQNGRVYDTKPFKIRLYPNKRYRWCLCGMSKSQPMCDGTHSFPAWKCTIKPVPFEVAEEKDYWLCNCKQTKLRPFCDGSHKKL